MPRSTPKTAPSTEEELSTEQKVTKSYTVALGRLKEKHLPEFNTLRKAAAEELGVTWNPQPTKAEKAEAQIRQLVEDNPELAEKYPSLFGSEDTPDQPDPDAGGEESEDSTSPDA